ncbi:YncE family protein [Cytobacillus sp. FJAT-54145]|uniref:YncE family protein n=1 Tax=Cytobacillus spartinae TaxID=3299023 RepID=A0ABW6K944_9BACI
MVLNEDASTLYVANNKTNDISVIDMNTLKEETRIDVGIHPDGIAYLKK